MLEFEQSTHTYTVDGREVPSVTQILGRVATRRSDDGCWNSLSGVEWMTDERAANFGTQLHKAIEYELLGVDAEFDPALTPYVAGMHKWRSEHSYPEAIIHNGLPLVERPMYSDSLDVCGTPDLAVMFDGKPYVIDWKSGIQNPINEVQGGAYTLILEENTGIKNWGTITVYLNEDGTYLAKLKEARHARPDANRFRSVLNVYRMGR